MNDKLIKRAALKYRNWMVDQSQRCILNNEVEIKRRLQTAIKKSGEINNWANRFIRGYKPRIQSCTFLSGITNPGVHKSIATKMIPDLRDDVVFYINSATQMLKTMTNKSPVIILSPREAIEEIKAINDGWSDVKFKDGILSVPITNVTLEDENESVDLGNFLIKINLINPLFKLRIESTYGVQSAGGYYHPHVSDEELCTGDGDMPMEYALFQGRLEDYFRIVETILRTYNGESFYEKLSGWYNPDHEGEFHCESCDEWRCDDESCYCEGCETAYCDNCAGGSCCTECEEWHCNECNSRCSECSGCSETLCDKCVTPCSTCENTFCMPCLSTCVICKTTCCESCTSSCSSCADTMCEDCSVECDYCNENICKDCQTNCVSCEVMICPNCEEDHNCLLAKISN